MAGAPHNRSTADQESIMHRVSITDAIPGWLQGESQVPADVQRAVYSTLRRMALGQLRRESSGHTLQPTDLVHEAYLRLRRQRLDLWQGQGHFYSIAARLMRRILTDHARRKAAAKRGSDVVRVALEDSDATVEGVTPEVLELDRALGRLEAMDPRQARIVELRFFAGLTVEETAAALGLGTATVKREWRIAKAWLQRALEPGVAGG
jgi:RNA polymerase sigma factor (TIGR02999 family)